jgi:hypothetical protein
VPLAMRLITSESFGTLEISILYTSCVVGTQRGHDGLDADRGHAVDGIEFGDDLRNLRVVKSEQRIDARRFGRSPPSSYRR